MAKLVNLTPHAITIRLPTGQDVSIPSSGVARVSSTPGPLTSLMLDIGEVPVALPTTFGEVEGLPAPEADTLFVVSALVGAALKGSRPDVVMPGTGPQDGCIREDGKVVAVTRLVRA